MIFDVTSFGRRGIVDTQRKPKNPTAFKTSIFGKSYTTVWFDEAHEYRGTGRAFIGALHLRFQSRFVGLASGTPLYTKPSVRTRLLNLYTATDTRYISYRIL